MTHELDRIAEVYALEQRKIDFELDHALARVEMLRKTKENLSRLHMQAQARYMERAKAEIFNKDEKND